MTATGETESKVCRTCGSPMVLSTVKRGSRTGQQVWHCSDFSCRTFENVEGSITSTPRHPDVEPKPFAGESAQARFEHDRAKRHQRLRTTTPLLLGLGSVLAVLAYFAIYAVVLEPRIAAGAAVVVCGVVAYVVIRDTPEVIDWGRGAEAERAVGERLDRLEPLGFVTLYDRRIQGRWGNIDAITIGPPGVFVVETKWRRRGVEIINGVLEVGGRFQEDPVRQVVELAMLVQVSIADAMNEHHMTVRPVICFTKRSIEGDRAGGVPVVTAMTIEKYMTSLPVVLDGGAVQELAKRLDDALPPFTRRSQ